MNRRPRDVAFPALASIALLVLYVIVWVAGNPRHDNRRHERLVQRGNEVESRSGTSALDGDDLTLSASGVSKSSTAAWDLDSYEVTHLLAHARDCQVKLFFLDTALTSSSRRGLVDILVDGTTVQSISFSRARAGYYALSKGRLLPANVTPRVVDLVPLDRRYGFVIPLAPKLCNARHWTIGIRTRDVDWRISWVGLLLDFTPERAPLFGSAGLTALAGGTLALTFLGALFLVLRALSGIGSGPLLGATLLLALAPLTYDQWDFRIWIRFAEVASFGRGDPAFLWSASPLWTFIPSLFSTLTVASYVFTGEGSRALTEFLLKVAIALAHCFNAYAIARQAAPALKRFVALTALLVPAALYAVAGGYREPFAGAFVLLGFMLALRGRLAVSTAVLVAAASVSESLLPVVLMPAALALTAAGSLGRRASRSALLAALGVALFGAEWMYLIPHDVAKAALSWRFGAAHLGGASWTGALGGLNILPTWIPAQSPFFGAAVFVAAAAFPAMRFFHILRRPALSSSATFTDVLGVFVALVGSFFLAFRGVDPNTWYTLLVLTLLYFARADALSPFPLLFGSLVGLAFYAVVGLGEFVNRSYFWPYDRGLLGILGISRYVFDLMINALALCLIFAVSCGNTKLLFSRRSPWFFALFASAVAATAIRSYPLDVVFCGGVTALVGMSFARQIGVQRHYRLQPAAPQIRFAAAVAFLAGGALLGPRSIGAAVSGLAGLIVAVSGGAGLCDIVLGSGAIALLVVQRGFGWTSIAGWVAFSITVLLAGVYGARAVFESRQLTDSGRGTAGPASSQET